MTVHDDTDYVIERVQEVVAYVREHPGCTVEEASKLNIIHHRRYRAIRIALQIGVLVADYYAGCWHLRVLAPTPEPRSEKAEKS